MKKSFESILNTRSKLGVKAIGIP